MGDNQQGGSAPDDAEDHIDGEPEGDGKDQVVDESLKSDSEESDPREKFFSEFAAEDEEVPSDPGEDDDEEEPVDGEGDEEEEQPDSDEEEEDDEDDEDVDLGVDLSDLVEGDEEEEAESGFDPSASIPKAVWKKLPQEARTHIDRSRRYMKQQDRKLKTLEPQAQWTTQVLSAANKAGVSNDDLLGWMELGFRAQQGDDAAIGRIGAIAAKGGFKPDVDLDMGELDEYLANEVEEFNLTREQAKAIKAKLKAKPAEQPRQPQQQAQQPQQQAQQPVNTQYAEVQQAAMNKIAEADTRFSKRFGNNWPNMRERIRKEVVLAQAATPTTPDQWPKLWIKTAEAEAKKTLKRSKSRLRGNSDSLGRGDNVGTRPASSSDSGDPRESFLRQFTS